MRGTRLYVNTPTGIAAYHSSQLLVGREAAKGDSISLAIGYVDCHVTARTVGGMVGRKKGNYSCK